MIFKHFLDAQIFNLDSAISHSEFPAKLMGEIIPLIGDSVIQSGQSEPCLPSVGRAFLFLAQSSVHQFQPAFRFSKDSWVFDDLTIRYDSKALDTDINADNIFIRMLDNRNINLTTEYSKPLTCSVLFDGQGLDFAFWNSMQDNWHITNPVEFQSFIRQQLESSLRKSYAVHSAFESRKAFLFTGRVFHSAKEVVKRFMNPVRNILFDLRMNLRIFACQMFVIVKLPHSLVSIFISLFGHVKKFVIDSFASLERIDYPTLLLMRGVYPEFIHPELHSKKELIEILKGFGCIPQPSQGVLAK